jgi:hypothetical protein
MIWGGDHEQSVGRDLAAVVYLKVVVWRTEDNHEKNYVFTVQGTEMLQV